MKTMRQVRMMAIAGVFMLAMLLLTSFSGQAVKDICDANPATSIERRIK